MALPLVPGASARLGDRDLRPGEKPCWWPSPTNLTRWDFVRLQNCYVRALQVAVRRERGDSIRHASCGFELERFTAGVTGSLRQVLSKVAEWGSALTWPQLTSRELLTASGMRLRHRLSCRRAYILEESAHFCVNLLISRTDSAYKVLLDSPEFQFARVTRQGSVEGPDLWNQLLHNALREPAARWETEGIGFRLATDDLRAQKKRRGPASDAVDNGGQVLHHVCWANDLSAMSGTMDRLTRNVKDMTTCVELLGIQWKEGPHYCCGDIRRVQG